MDKLDYTDFSYPVTNNTQDDYDDMMSLGFSFEDGDGEARVIPHEKKTRPVPVKEPKNFVRASYSKRRQLTSDELFTRNFRIKRHRSFRTFGGSRWKRKGSADYNMTSLERVPIPYTSHNTVKGSGSIDANMCNVIFGVAHMARFDGDEGELVIRMMVGDDDETVRHVERVTREMILTGLIRIMSFDEDHGVVTMDKDVIERILSGNQDGINSRNSIPIRINGGKKPSEKTVSTFYSFLLREYEIHHKRGGSESHLDRIHCDNAGVHVLFLK